MVQKRKVETDFCTQGTTFPALNAILSKWVPVGERAKLGTLVYAGSQIGKLKLFIKLFILELHSDVFQSLLWICSMKCILFFSGTVMANSISGTLIHATKSWASVFYFFGVMGCLWTFLWTILCYSDPDSHPYISDKEKSYLQREMCKSSTFE